MNDCGLGIKPRRRFVRTTDSNHALPVFPSLYRNIIPAKPDDAWVRRHHVYLDRLGVLLCGAILDTCSRKVVGYAISSHIYSQLMIAALDAAMANRKPAPYTCIHQATAAASTPATSIGAP